jgi:hypothetical protein
MFLVQAYSYKFNTTNECYLTYTFTEFDAIFL